jgi:membrane fusion protein, multidrug efflux system
MKKTILYIFLLLAGLILIKLLFFPGKKEKESNPAGGRSKGPVPVKAIVLKGRTFQDKLHVSGSVIANEEVELKPEISGRIEAIYFKEGTRVSKGQLLAKLNDQDLLAQLEKQESLKKLAADRAQRQKRLLEIKAISQEEFDIAGSQLAGINADIRLLKAQIAKTEIRAPFEGSIGLKYISGGSFVSPESRIALLQSLNPLKIDFSVPEKYAASIKKGDTITFTVEGSDSVYSATIYAVESRIDPSTRTLQVRALYGNKRNEVFPGAFARIEVPLRKIEHAIMIPTETIIPELKRQKVFVVKNGKAVSQHIETGNRTETSILVKKGLETGDTLIVTGIMQLKPGTPVKAVVTR